MSHPADPRTCPRCGSDRYSGGLTTAIRTCRDCGAPYRPPARGWERGLVAAVFIVPSLLGLAVAVAVTVGLIAAPPMDAGLALGGGVCAAVVVAASAAGLFFGFRELGARRTTVVLADPEPVKIGRLVPPARARAIVRELADVHGAKHIAAQLDWIEPSRIANARARFARAMTSRETPLVLVDSSFLRNGKAGFLLTNRAFYSSQLPVPIPLEDVRTVSHRPPDGGAMLSIYVGVGLVGALTALGLWFCSPIGLLLVFPVLLDRKRRPGNRLFIDDRLAYAGGKSLAWGFWQEALRALAAEARDPAGRTRVEVLEAFADGSDEPRTTAAPPWDVTERGLRALDGSALRMLRLWTGEPGRSIGLEVIGGAGRYALRELPDGWVYYDPVAGEDSVEVCPGHQTPAYSVCTDLERVVEIARGFAEAGSFE